jgi:hypothetical protein
MKRLILVTAACVIAGPAFAQPPHQSTAGVTNSARVTQTAGAMAFSQIAQGSSNTTIEAPRNSSLVHVESGAFVLPYVNATQGGRIYVNDPIGNVVSIGDVDVDLSPIP